MATTREEILEFINNEDNQEDVNSILKEKDWESKESIEGLKIKNKQVITKFKKLRTDHTELQSKYDSIDMDLYNEFLNSGTDDKNKGKEDPEYLKIQRENKTMKDLLESEKTARLTLEDSVNDTLKETTIMTAMDAAGLDLIKHKKVLKDAFLPKAKIEMIDGKKTVIISDADELGSPATDYFKDFAASEDGKTYVKVPSNTGIEQKNFNGSGNGKVMKQEDHQSMNPQAQAKFFADGGTLK